MFYIYGQDGLIEKAKYILQFKPHRHTNGIYVIELTITNA